VVYNLTIKILKGKNNISLRQIQDSTLKDQYFQVWSIGDHNYMVVRSFNDLQSAEKFFNSLVNIK